MNVGKTKRQKFVNATKKKPNIVKIVPNWSRYILENLFPKKYQSGVDIKVIVKYNEKDWFFTFYISVIPS